MIYNLKKDEKKYWVLFKEPIIKECRNQVYMVLSDRENLRNPMINENHVIYEGIELLKHPFIQEDGTLREATDKELIDKGIYSLEDFEILIGDFVKSIYEFPIPETIAKPIFNKDTLEWKESATLEEKYSFWKDKCKMVSSEMFLLESSGFGWGTEFMSLKTKLEEYKNNYITASHEIALEMDKSF